MAIEEHVIELIPAFALGALDPLEIGQVEAHLKRCQSCQEELAAYRLVVDDLALAVPGRQPPDRVKAALMQRLSRSGAQAPERLPWFQQAYRSFQRLIPAWSAVSLVLILTLVASNLFLWGQLRQHQSEWRTIKLAGTDAAPLATGLLVVSHDGNYGTLVVDGLPALDETLQYQLWLIENGVRTSGGLFSVDAQGYSSLWIESPKALDTYQSFGVTVEPFGGSPGPTGVKVLGGDL